LIAILCDTEYLACADPLRRAGLSAAAKTCLNTTVLEKMLRPIRYRKVDAHMKTSTVVGRCFAYRLTYIRR